MARRCLIIASVAIVFALLTESCSTSKGLVQGHVLVFAPVPHPGSTTTLPIARFRTTVEARHGSQTVARQEVAPGAQFHFSLSPGSYEFTASGAPFCSASATIVAGQTTNVNVRCVEP